MVDEKMSVLLSLFVLFFPLRKNKENLKIWGAAEGGKMISCEILWTSTENILNVENYITATFQFFQMHSKINYYFKLCDFISNLYQYTGPMPIFYVYLYPLELLFNEYVGISH